MITLDTYIDKRLTQRLDSEDASLRDLAGEAVAKSWHMEEARRVGFMPDGLLRLPVPPGWRAYLDAERRHPRERTAPVAAVRVDFNPYGGVR